MKTKTFTWNVEILGDGEIDYETLDIVGERVKKGYLIGKIALDCTDYEKINRLCEKISSCLGRNFDYKSEDLALIIEFARKNGDKELVCLLMQLMDELED